METALNKALVAPSGVVVVAVVHQESGDFLKAGGVSGIQKRGQRLVGAFIFALGGWCKTSNGDNPQ